MPRRAASGTKGLIKRHHGCTHRRTPTSCDCAWSGRYRGKEVVLSKWARQQIDPRTKGAAVKVLNRFIKAVDDHNFDPAGERPALGTADTLSAFITEWQTHYAEEKGLSQNSLSAMLKVLSTGTLGGHSLEYLAGNSQEIERWLNATGTARKWSNKTWNNYRELLHSVLHQATRWKVNGKPRLLVNPVTEIAARVAERPEQFKQRHLIEDVEDRLFAAVELLNRTQRRRRTTPETVDAIRAGLAGGRTGRDLAAAYGVSASVVSAVKQGRIWNPEAVQPGTKGTEMRRRLVAAFDGGLRAGEMMRIELAHVNWSTVLIEPLDGPPIEAYEICLPPRLTKGGKTTGKVEYIYAATARFRQVLEARRFALHTNPPTQRFIFGTEEGHYQQGFRRLWHTLFTLAGLDYGRDLGLVWHTIRHEYISRLAELTKDPVLVQELARHKNLKTTQGYFHTRRNRQIAAAASLDRQSR